MNNKQKNRKSSCECSELISKKFKTKIEKGHQDYIKGNTIKIETKSIWDVINVLN